METDNEKIIKEAEESLEEIKELLNVLKTKPEDGMTIWKLDVQVLQLRMLTGKLGA